MTNGWEADALLEEGERMAEALKVHRVHTLHSGETCTPEAHNQLVNAVNDVLPATSWIMRFLIRNHKYRMKQQRDTNGEHVAIPVPWSKQPARVPTRALVGILILYLILISLGLDPLAFVRVRVHDMYRSAPPAQVAK
jgi:hypothetical protein